MYQNATRKQNRGEKIEEVWNQSVVLLIGRAVRGQGGDCRGNTWGERTWQSPAILCKFPGLSEAGYELADNSDVKCCSGSVYNVYKTLVVGVRSRWGMSTVLDL